MQNITKIQSNYMTIQQQMQQAQAAGNTDQAAQLQTQAQDIMKSVENYIMGYADTVKNPLLGIFAVNSLNPDDHLDYMTKYADKVKGMVNDSKLAKEYVDNIQRLSFLAVGSTAPEIDLPGRDGKNITLSSLKGQYVLVDFWASWCHPCRNENPNVVAAYNKYKSKGFTVYSVSLDGVPGRPGDPKQLWIDAINQDGLSWPNHVSDLKGWQSSAAQEYKIQSIPSNFLLDKDGKIVGKNLRGAALDEKLAQIFGS
jgi:peroxiredoxin